MAKIASEPTLGLPIDRSPDYAPIDEAHELRPRVLVIDKARRMLGYSPDFTWRELF